MSAPKVVELAKSRLGQNQYTQTYLRQNFFSGYSDCSSMCWKCYEKAYGIYIGSWTGEQVGKGDLIFKRNNVQSWSKITAAEMTKLQPGDLIFYGYGDYGEAEHVEMYMGNGKQIGHGWGVGPIISDTLSYSHSGGIYQARRYYSEDSSGAVSSSADSDQKQDPVVPVNKTGVLSNTPKWKCKVVADELNARTWAGVENSLCKKSGPFPYGTILEVCDAIPASDGSIWLFVKYNGYFSFVHGDYVELI